MLDDSFKQRIRLGRLYDVYGPLLTAKQQSCMELYFCDDLSLAEIAAELDVSRQAVHDLIHRVEQILERYETKMKLLEREENSSCCAWRHAGCLTDIWKRIIQSYLKG